MSDKAIAQLVEYGVQTGLLDPADRTYAVNQLLECMKQDAIEEVEFDKDQLVLTDILKDLLDEAAKKGLIEDSVTFRDLFDSKLMNVLVDKPSHISKKFWDLYAEEPKKATDWFYKLSCDSNYIRKDRIAKDKHWTVDSPYGELECSINLSKPEKDPKAIAAAKLMKQSSYPKCQLCVENEGYYGRANHPGRSNHRIIPLTINNSAWGFQYSPYVYFNEHCILLNQEHTPMAINRATFQKLFDFIEQFPHYFLGSNADLPIVGGSILTHDHFQGGNHEFPMAKAPVEIEFKIPGYEDIDAGIVKWPMSVIRLQGDNKERLIELADHILKKWRSYSDPEAAVFAETDGEPHNTITPIVRTKNGRLEMDLVLRNNLTTDEFPMGLYHPHPQWHNIKKENIGLIEVMGLAILPARLKNELARLGQAIVNKEDISADEELAKHADWVNSFIDQYPDINEENVEDILLEETGRVFSHVLEDAGVYKADEKGREAFMRFVKTL